MYESDWSTVCYMLVISHGTKHLQSICASNLGNNFLVMFFLALWSQQESVVLLMKNQSENICPMSSGPEIKLRGNKSLLRGICAGTKDFQRLKSYHVTNPMWSDGERKEKKGIIVVEAHKPNHNLNSMTSTPSASSLLLFIVSPSLSVCTDNCLQRCQLAKATQMRRKKVSARSNPGELEKRAAEVPLSLSLCLSNSPVSWWKCPAGWGH